MAGKRICMSEEIYDRSNPILEKDVVYITDENDLYNVKIGDGISTWKNTPWSTTLYLLPEDAGFIKAVLMELRTNGTITDSRDPCDIMSIKNILEQLNRKK